MQQQSRPMPPTRRTSQIISGNFSSTTGPLVGATGGLLAATVLNTDETTRTEVTAVITSDETENLPPPPAFLLEANSPGASPTPKR